jgi:hypothetical protein
MKVRGCGQFPVLEEAIEKGKSLMRTEFRAVSANIVSFGLRFCRIVEEFRFFETPILSSLDVILSNQCFVPSLNFMIISNIDFTFFLMEKVMKKHFDSVYLRKMKDRIEENEFHHDLHEKSTFEFSVPEIPICCNSTFLIEIGGTIYSKIGTCDATFILNQNQIEEYQFSWKSASGKIEQEFFVLREMMQLSGGSSCESVSIFYRQN